jgi:hypothetical protein
VGVTGAAGWQGWLGLDRLGREVRGEGEGDAGVGVGEDAVGWDRRRLWEWRIRFGCSQSLVVHSSVCLSVCLSVWRVRVGVGVDEQFAWRASACLAQSD